VLLRLFQRSELLVRVDRLLKLHVDPVWRGQGTSSWVSLVKRAAARMHPAAREKS